MSPVPGTTEAKRFPLLDAMRGVASVWVVLYHLYNKNLVPMTGSRLPQPLDWICDNGHLGVYMFFVISGFAIMQSIRGRAITWRFAGRYALRRSIRLDLPYWFAIAAMTILTIVTNQAKSANLLPVPSPGSLIAHVFYLQAFAGYPDILGVLWTLRFEVQFYLALVAFTSISQHASFLGRWGVFGPLWIMSLLCATNQFPVDPAWALYCWIFFFCGVAVNWVHHRELPVAGFVGLAASMLVVLLWVRANHRYEASEVATALATSALLLVVSLRGAADRLTLGPILQWLGRISYSLYLVHMLVGTPTIRLLLRRVSHHPNSLVSAGFVLVGLAVSLAAAQFMYQLVERPAQRLSRRVTL